MGPSLRAAGLELEEDSSGSSQSMTSSNWTLPFVGNALRQAGLSGASASLSVKEGA